MQPQIGAQDGSPVGQRGEREVHQRALDAIAIAAVGGADAQHVPAGRRAGLARRHKVLKLPLGAYTSHAPSDPVPA